MHPINAKCPFCGDDSFYSVPGAITYLYQYDCENVCGIYYIEIDADEYLKQESDLRILRLNSIRENIIASEQKLIPFWTIKRRKEGFQGLEKISANLVPKCFDDAAADPVSHSNKTTELLLLLAESLSGRPPFSEVTITKKCYSKYRIEDREELYQWMKVLQDKSYVVSKELDNIGQLIQDERPTINQDFSYMITPLGWIEVESLLTSVNSGKVFLAMKFSNNPERHQVQQAIERACRETGWEAVTIDREEFLGCISDEIIAKINQSKFVIAEFSGQNHGVYFEAGYASGRGLPVIYVVKDADCKELHFDTRHLNHIVWSAYDDLYQKVKNRIEAVINR